MLYSFTLLYKSKLVRTSGASKEKAAHLLLKNINNQFVKVW